MPDVAWLAIVCGGIAALWSIVSTVLTLVFGRRAMQKARRGSSRWRPEGFRRHAGY